MKNAVIGLLVIVLAAAAYYYFRIYSEQNQALQIPPPVIAEAVKPTPEPEPELIREPVREETMPPPEPEPSPPPEPLPLLAESDTMARQSLSELVGESGVIQYFVTEDMISRFVASVDALTSRQVPDQIQVILGPGGVFEVTSNDQPENEIKNAEGDSIPQFLMDPVNHQRYTRQVEMFEAVDADELVVNYQKMSPLFKQAWAELGYSDDGFDQRLLEVIDSLLDTPDVRTPIHLIKPEAFYLFADPRLEGLPAGQKLMLRMGHDNAIRVKAKLREIRNLLAAQY
jgi:hypothetical protein